MPRRGTREPRRSAARRDHPRPPSWPRPRWGRRLLMRRLMVLVQSQEQLGLAPEVVVEAADAGAGTGDHLGDAGLGEAVLAEDLASRLQHGLTRLSRTTPLPRGLTRHAAEYRPA